MTVRSDAIELLDGSLQECLTDYCHPNEFGGYDTDSRKAAEVVVETLLANPDTLAALLAAAGPAALTAREREIVVLVAAGHPNKTIASLLSISPFTVSSYLRRCFAKLGVNSRAHLVAVAMDRGLVPTRSGGLS